MKYNKIQPLIKAKMSYQNDRFGIDLTISSNPYFKITGDVKNKLHLDPISLQIYFQMENLTGD